MSRVTRTRDPVSRLPVPDRVERVFAEDEASDEVSRFQLERLRELVDAARA
ncbi:hypothetical protein L1785_09390 [Antribacter sp. KLBMP9083]|uniref:Uncharacterized protein n=1 Tax=Antribacter soli TaxID=2910976 RepID=A0AA41QD08_9MICO|nr:hypothetical protein [Antribacter soli]MCF4121195.1 hypothetical protein [Antribacter soli]